MEWQSVIGGYSRQVSKDGVTYTALLWRGKREQVWFLEINGEKLRIGRCRIEAAIPMADHNLFKFLGYQEV